MTKAAIHHDTASTERSIPCNLLAARPLPSRAWLQEVDLQTFGFSAFLKLLSLNDKPQRSLLRRRFGPPSTGYDFHRSFRLHARRFLLDDEPISEVIASAGTITRVPERRSAVSALQRLELWRHGRAGTIFACEPVVFESPRNIFRVKFEPDFGLRVHGRKTAFHLWNTQRPNLAPGPTYAALALVAEAYQGREGALTDVGVLSAREPPRAFLLSEVSDPSALAASIVERFEDAILGAAIPVPPTEDRPTP